MIFFADREIPPNFKLYPSPVEIKALGVRKDRPKGEGGCLLPE